MSNKSVARTVGILFIIGSVAGGMSAVATTPILSAADYLTKVSENETQVIVGALLVLVMAVSLALIPIVLFPIFRKYNESLAIGAVVFRGALEAVAYLSFVLILLLFITVGREYTGASAVEMTSLQQMGTLLQGAEDWTRYILGIVFSIGALMIYWLFYISKLIPNWLAIWGFVGAVLYLLTQLIGMFGLGDIQILLAPLAIQELFLAFWLIIKGFNPNPAVPPKSAIWK